MDGSSLGDRLADRPESAEEGIGIRQEVLDKESRKGNSVLPINQNTMKKVLKGWLIDNAVTTDNKTDKILLLASAGSLTLDDVLEEMYKQDTGLRPETMRHSVTLYHRIVMDLILNGYSVNTGLFRAVPS